MAAPKPSPCVDAAANVLAPEPCPSVDVTVGVEAVGSEAAVALAPTPSPKMDVATEGKAVALAPTPSLKVDVATEGKTVVALSPTPSPKVDAATEGKAVAAPAPTPSPKSSTYTQSKDGCGPGTCTQSEVDVAMEGEAVVALAPTPPISPSIPATLPISRPRPPLHRIPLRVTYPIQSFGRGCLAFGGLSFHRAILLSSLGSLGLWLGINHLFPLLLCCCCVSCTSLPSAFSSSRLMTSGPSVTGIGSFRLGGLGATTAFPLLGWVKVPLPHPPPLLSPPLPQPGPPLLFPPLPHPPLDWTAVLPHPLLCIATSTFGLGVGAGAATASPSVATSTFGLGVGARATTAFPSIIFGLGVGAGPPPPPLPHPLSDWV